MVQRRFPRPKDLAPLLRFKPFEPNGTKRRLDKALTIYDLRTIAKRRTPQAPFDYTDGAAEEELSLERARRAFRNIEFHPNILRDVSNVTTEREVLGGPSRFPLSIAPTGFTRMMHTEGEHAGASAAGEFAIPFTLSTMGTASVEDIATVEPLGRRWFQLYLWTNRDQSLELVHRARDAGYDTLVVTVDVPVAGARLRDKRNGMSIPPALTAKTIVNAIPRPWWWFDFLTTPPLEFASLNSWGGTVGELIDKMFDPTITFDDLKWIRKAWPGNLVIKGVQSLDDAVALAKIDVDGIVLSNHGGRQLDRAPIPFHLLPAVNEEIGSDVELMLDTGIMSGADVVAAVAMGARSTMIGRAYLYGLMAGGRAGVVRALEILTSEIVRTMQLLGVTHIDELNAKHVTQLAELTPVSPATHRKEK
ncbi:MAG: alpha-hydroxy acid oxidase [Pontimonas sp.]